MKKIFKKPLFFLATLIMAFSCQKDDIAISSQETFNKNPNEVTLDFFKKTTKINDIITFAKKEFAEKQSTLSRENPELPFSGFVIDTELIYQCVLNNGNLSFSFHIVPLEACSPDQDFNLVIKQNDLGEWEMSIFQLSINEDESNQDRFSSIEKIYSTSSLPEAMAARWVWMYGETTSYHCTNTGDCASDTCDNCGLCITTTITFQYVYIADNEPDPNPLDPNFNYNGGGGGGTSPNNPYEFVIDAPNLNLAEELIDIFELNRTTDATLIDWINNHYQTLGAHDYVTEIFTFILINNFSEASITEAKMRLEVEAIDTQGGWDFSNSGTYQNREGLAYVATHHPPNSDGTMYLLQNGRVLYVTQTPRIVNSQDNLSYLDTIGSNEEPLYHYIYDYTSKRWYEYMLPQANYDCLSCDLNLFFESVLENGGLLIGRYILPVEDILIVITGQDFYGAEQSRAVAGAFILVDIIPGSQLVKGIKLIKYGDEAIQAVEAVIKYADDIYKTQKQTVKNVLDGVWMFDLDEFGNTIRKGNFGEMVTDTDLYSKGYEPLHIRTTDLDDSSVLNGGIDSVFQNPETGEYIIVESKYNSSKLSQTPIDGPQMSDSWIEGGTRLLDAVGQEIRDDILSSGYTGVLAKILPDGSIQYFELNSLGQIIGPWIP